MNDLIIWFKEEEVEILAVANFDVTAAAQRRAFQLENTAWITPETVEVTPKRPARQSTVRPAGAVKWPNFLDGLGLLQDDPACQFKLARAYCEKLANAVKDLHDHAPDRVWLILLSSVEASAAAAMRQAAFTIYPQAEAIYAVLREVPFGLGLAQALLRANKLNSHTPLRFLAVGAANENTVEILRATLRIKDDQLNLQFGGWMKLETPQQNTARVVRDEADMILTDSSATATKLLPPFLRAFAGSLPVEVLAFAEVWFEGLTGLLTSATPPAIEFSFKPVLGFGFADGVRARLPLAWEGLPQTSQSGFVAFAFGEAIPPSGLALSLYANCLGGPRVGRPLGTLMIPGVAPGVEAVANQAFCLGIEIAADGRATARLYRTSSTPIASQLDEAVRFDLPGLAY